MELHHSKHHQTYVNGLNSAIETLTEAEAKGDSAKAASVAPLLNFHGGGHVNHTLFWENLAPANKDGGGEPEGELKVCGNQEQDGQAGARCCPRLSKPPKSLILCVLANIRLTCIAPTESHRA